MKTFLIIVATVVIAIFVGIILSPILIIWDLKEKVTWKDIKTFYKFLWDS